MTVYYVLEKYNLVLDAIIFGQDSTFPSVLELIPYGKNTFTAERDHLRHSWLASHGYVCIRPDIRGSGESEGYYYGEYTSQELDDACEIIGKCRNFEIRMFSRYFCDIPFLSIRLDIKASLVKWERWHVWEKLGWFQRAPDGIQETTFVESCYQLLFYRY